MQPASITPRVWSVIGTALPNTVGVVLGKLVALELEHAERSVHAAAVVLARDRLLARVAPLLEVDRSRVEPGFGGKDAIVELAPVTRCGRPDPEELELVLVDLAPGRKLLVDHLVRRNAELAVRDAAGGCLTADHESGRVLLELDRDLRGEATTRERGAEALGEIGLGQQQEVVHSAAVDGHRGDDASLRREEKRIARLARPERLDVVRQHPLEIRRRVGPDHAHESRVVSCRSRAAVPGMRTSVAAVFRGRAERKVIDAGYDPARLPPGQYLTEKWPVLHAGSIPTTDLATWDFFVEGEVENPLRLSWDELNALPRTTHTQDIHCVTRWSRFDVTFEGVHWSAIEPLVKPLPSAHYVVAHAEEGYTANVPIAFLRDPLSLIATHADGEPLTPEHGGPLRLVIPRKYFWKSAKWLRGLELTANDRPGFWERYGYHNDADPFEEERYGF